MTSQFKRVRLHRYVAASFALLLAAQSLHADDGAGVKQERVGTDASVQRHVIPNAGFDELHVNVGADFTRYQTVLIEEAPVSFVPRWVSTHRDVVTNRDIARLKKEMSDALKTELVEKLSTGGRYRIVDEPEIDTLLIKPEIKDLNVAAPGSGRHVKLVDSAGYATLSLKMVDAHSGLSAVRILDHKQAKGSSGREYFMANRAANEREFRLLMAAWAERVRRQLDLLNVPRHGEEASAE